MNKMGKLVLSALSVLGLAACAVSSSDEAVVVGESQDALVSGTGFSGGFFGSDTLFDAMSSAVAASGVSGLTYLGTGSGNGERCLRGTAPGVTYGGVTYCNGTKQQTIAPMSRDFNGTCQSGDKSNRIAKDAVALWTKSTQTATDADTSPTDSVKGAFCGDGSGSAVSCAAFDTWGEFTTGSSNPSNLLKLYRRDDASGTTDAFKSLTGCTTFCAGVKVVVDDATAGPRLSTDTAGTSSLTMCSSGDSVTTCLGKIAASDVDVLAYAGLDATNAGAKKLTVDGTAATEANVRSGAYKYSRYLYLNEGNGTRAAAEQDFLDWAFGVNNPADAVAFENALISNGFIACTSPSNSPRTPLNCGAGKCP
ncbi:substrate-binding domain-containing protein [Sorangium sp. So ce448]|uniref:substrate-binding domain-containing protein n=1 Tax=Sorangium sp. So ce448 TaxID=3133314 RepID=UPI003F5FCF90